MEDASYRLLDSFESESSMSMGVEMGALMTVPPTSSTPIVPIIKPQASDSVMITIAPELNTNPSVSASDVAYSRVRHVSLSGASDGEGHEDHGNEEEKNEMQRIHADSIS